MEETDVLIIGAGLAGLSTAYHLRRPDLILEAEDSPGGRARSVVSGESTYDYTGHLLHLRRTEMKELVESLLPGKFIEIERKAGIYMRDTFLPYPFQVNFHALPKAEVKECLLGFIEAWKGISGKQDFADFKEWALATFGEGICRHFMFPYNEKLFRIALEEMSADWVSWSVPQPDLETVVDGALGAVKTGLGYNAHFLYPKEGGIGILANALADKVEPVLYSEHAVEIDPGKRLVRTDSGKEIHYKSLVSTMPLPELLKLINDRTAKKLDAWRQGLRWVNVFNLNLTLDSPPNWDWQWLYLPEPDFRCYRIGISSNFSPALAPKGCCTIYTEVSYLPGELPDEEQLREEILGDLRRVGLLRKGVKIVDEIILRIEPAYVLHDHFRKEHLASIHKWLRQHGIVSTGRWGAWEYGSMEDALWQGYTVAEELNAGRI